MNTREYLTAIRVTGFKEMPGHEENGREDIIIIIFLKGINNRNASKATELMKSRSVQLY